MVLQYSAEFSIQLPIPASTNAVLCVRVCVTYIDNQTKHKQVLKKELCLDFFEKSISICLFEINLHYFVEAKPT